MSCEKSPNCGGDRRSTIAKAKHINHPGNPLWDYRVSKGLTQRQLAEQLFICQQGISSMERGETRISADIYQYMEENP